VEARRGPPKLRHSPAGQVGISFHDEVKTEVQALVWLGPGTDVAPEHERSPSVITLYLLSEPTNNVIADAEKCQALVSARRITAECRIVPGG
jgi:hypothetical protein